MKNLIARVAFSATGIPKLQWLEDGSAFRYGLHRVRMESLKTLYHEEMKAAWKLFHELTDGIETPLEMEKLQDDDVSQTLPDWSFFSQEEGYYAKISTALLQHLYTRENDCFLIKGPRSEVLVNRRLAIDWLSKASKLNELLLVLWHISAGQPPRGTETCSVLYRNDQNSRRSLFMTLNGLASIIAYNKVPICQYFELSI
jgi:hypothetical protein